MRPTCLRKRRRLSNKVARMVIAACLRCASRMPGWLTSRRPMSSRLMPVTSRIEETANSMSRMEPAGSSAAGLGMILGPCPDSAPRFIQVMYCVHLLAGADARLAARARAQRLTSTPIVLHALNNLFRYDPAHCELEHVALPQLDIRAKSP